MMKQALWNIKKWVGCIFRPMQQYWLYGTVRARVRYSHYLKHKRLQKNTVLYESFYGRGMLCNPYAIFLELLHNPEFRHLKHVWVLDNMANHKTLIEQYAPCRNVSFISYDSKDYLKYLASAKYLINNSTFLPFFVKRKGQIYVNTWHGIPLKSLGFDLPNGKTEVANVLRNFFQTDYLLSANKFLTEIYTSSFKLEQLYKGTIIEEGYPRLDLLSRFSREEVLDKLKKYGMDVKPDKKIILYAPTWRGASFSQANSDVDCYFDFKRQMDKEIDTDKYQVLIKVHQRVYELSHDKLQEPYFVPATIDANEIMSVTDILISDFSSIFYDFLATGRPVLFYIPDIEEYKEERGLYQHCNQLPGPCTTDIHELAGWTNEIEKVFSKHEKQYREIQTWANTGTCGQISENVIDVVFRGNTENHALHVEKKTKKALFFNRGGMLANGITTSFLNMLKHIDYDTYDVSIMISNANDAKGNALIQTIPDEVRVFYRTGVMNLSLGDDYHHLIFQRFRRRNIQRSFYTRELYRCYGDVDFDIMIDFEGYNFFFSTILLQQENAKKYIWLHSDMMAEKELRFDWLEDVFQLYRYFDGVISCSREIMLVNREKMSGHYCDYNKFSYAKNFVDVERIVTGREQDAIRTFEDCQYIAANEETTSRCTHVDLVPFFPDTDENGEKNFRFVAVGRFSPEKNYENLIYAFHRLYQENHNIYLYILGDGPLRETITSLVYSLHLEEHIIITGNVNNPFTIMKYCDCFILPSLHEGQPMVVNEARVMKLPIIVSNFSSVNGVLLDDGQLVIGTSDQEIYQGLKAYTEGRVPCSYHFDPKQYNREAYHEFLTAIDESTPSVG